MRRQPTLTLLTATRPVDDLFKEVPAEPGSQHPQPDVIGQPTRPASLHIRLST
jgi:hypothetical protein